MSTNSYADFAVYGQKHSERFAVSVANFPVLQKKQNVVRILNSKVQCVTLFSHDKIEGIASLKMVCILWGNKVC